MRSCEDCDRVCLERPEAYVEALKEVGSFSVDHLDQGQPAATRAAASSLHPRCPARAISGGREVELGWAAISLRGLLSMLDPRGRVEECDRPGLLRRFSLSAGTRVLVLGTAVTESSSGTGPCAESRTPPATLAALNAACAIAPNYSLFLDDPRPQHLFQPEALDACRGRVGGGGCCHHPISCRVDPRGLGRLVSSSVPARWSQRRRQRIPDGKRPSPPGRASDRSHGEASRAAWAAPSPRGHRGAPLLFGIGRKLRFLDGPSTPAPSCRR